MDALLSMRGRLFIPEPVNNEIRDNPSRSKLDDALEDGSIEKYDAGLSPLLEAANRLGRDLSLEELEGYGHERVDGDIALLAIAMKQKRSSQPPHSLVMISDDKPLRQVCKTLSIPVSGSIGVLIRAVERGDVTPEEAKSQLLAMDEVGARFSASLLRRAERMIDEAAEAGEE